MCNIIVLECNYPYFMQKRNIVTKDLVTSSNVCELTSITIVALLHLCGLSNKISLCNA